MNINSLLVTAVERLQAVSDTPRLDAELLLAQVLQKPRSYLYAWSETKLTLEQHQHYQELISRRASGEPVAYISGEKEFWSLPFKVNRHTLIPRPETELLVEIALGLATAGEALRVADLGTGCGAIALALATERAEWQITATDISREALLLAQSNATRLECNNVKFYQGGWCEALPAGKYEIIVSNPPYIAEGERPLTKGIEFEPARALFAAGEGLQELTTIIIQAKSWLVAGGQLILEHGVAQGARVAELLLHHGYELTGRWRGASCGKLSSCVEQA